MAEKIISNNEYFKCVKQIIEQEGSVKIRIKGYSMTPVLMDNRDELLLSPCTKLKKWDIVLALLSNGQYVLHRIIKIDGNRITLMGDGNVRGCEFCYTKDIVAIVSEIYRYGFFLELKNTHSIISKKGHLLKADSLEWYWWILLSNVRRRIIKLRFIF